MSSVDDKLLRPSSDKSSEETAGDLTAAKRGEAQESGQAENEDEQVGENIEEAQMTAKNEKKGKEAAAKKKMPAQQKSLSAGTSKILQSAWTNIIPSFGLSFFYIYIHLLLKNVFGEKYFAPLGSEWFDKPGGFMAQRDRLGQAFSIPEMMAVLLITLIIFFALIFTLSVLSLLLEVVTNPLASFAKSADFVWSLLAKD